MCLPRLSFFNDRFEMNRLCLYVLCRTKISWDRCSFSKMSFNNRVDNRPLVASRLMQAPSCSTCPDILIKINGFERKANTQPRKHHSFGFKPHFTSFHYSFSCEVMLLISSLQQLPFGRVLCIEYTEHHRYRSCWNGLLLISQPCSIKCYQ